MIVESRVGSKGELFLTKEIRDRLNLKPGDRICFEIKDEILTVRKVSDLLDLLKDPSIGKPETPEAIEHDLKSMQDDAYQRSTEDSK